MDVVRCVLCVVSCLLSVVCCFLFVVRCLLIDVFGGWCSLCGDCCVVRRACAYVVCCLMIAV